MEIRAVMLLIGARRRALSLAAALVVAGLSWARPIAAQERPGAAAAAEKASGREHVVREGDTLWDLARSYLSDPFLWPMIYEANRRTVENPHRIYPPERLVIPPFPPAAPADAAAVPAPAVKEAPAARDEIKRTRFFSAGQAATPEREAPEFVATEEKAAGRGVQAGEYYAAAWLSERRDLPVVGELLRVVGHEPEDEKLSQWGHPLDRVYLRYVGRTQPQAGDRLLLVRPGGSLGRWGRMIEPVAILTVSSLSEEVMTAMVSKQFGTVLVEDVALPLEPFPDAAGVGAQPVEDGPVGSILSFREEQPLPGVMDQAFIDLGRDQGIEVGDELVAYVPERRAGGGFDERLPSESVARLRVIRVGERSATVRVVGVTHAALKPGLPVRLVARAPRG